MSGAPEDKPVTDDVTAAFAKRFWEVKETALFRNHWLGVPALQNPFDAWVIQEIIMETRPDVVVETGTFMGGGAVLWGSFLAMAGGGRVISVDISPHIHEHALEHRIVKERVEFIDGSSSDPQVARRVADATSGERVMVILDSDHSAAHVREELEVWSSLVTPGCYLIVQDGLISAIDPDHGPGPLEAIREWLPAHPEFEVDDERERMLFTVCPSGYLRRREAGETRAA